MSYEQDVAPAHNSKLFWETSNNIQSTPMNVDRLLREVATMSQQVESSRLSYNDVLAERDQLKEQAKVAEQRLTEVQRVVARYAVVEDPVVASDGFTYERRVINQYLEDCKSSKSEAISQQTKEVLNDTLVSNHSLRKLVDLVKDVRPDVVPELSERKPIAALGSSGLKLGENRSNTNDSDGAMLASDLEATWASAVQGKHRGGRRDEREERREDRRDDRRDDRREAGGGGGGGRGEYSGGGGGGGQSSGGSNNRSHPCIRVYGFCNFKDECAFAKYPYDACLNNIKGKCRFGNSCKELHVNPMEKKYQNPKAQQSVQQAAGPTKGSAPTTPATGPVDGDKRKGKK